MLLFPDLPFSMVALNGVEMNKISMGKKVLALCAMCLISFTAFSSEVASAAFVEGCHAYSEGNWTSAEFLLKKAVGYSENQNPDTYYMLISAESAAGDDRTALDDCDFFMEHFPESIYYTRIQYQKGKSLYRLGEYEKAIIVLSDFCHQNEKDDMYSFALFYIGESLFAGYKYDEASAIYQRIVTDFPESEKSAAAQYRLESILQRAREEKLLYLLKQTGEEYLSAKEEYEKQLRLYNADAINTQKQKLTEAQQKNRELEDKIKDLEMQLNALKLDYAKSLAAQEAAVKVPVVKEVEVDVPSAVPYDETREQISALKKKALDAQMLLDSKQIGE